MSILLDIKYALRLLFKSPRFTALTLFVLIGGLSISLYTFSFLYTLVYKPLPMPESDTAERIGVSLGSNPRFVPRYEFLQAREQLTAFAELGVYEDIVVRYSRGQAGKNYPANYVEPGFFHFSRTRPVLGRVIEPEDLRADAPPVAVISHQVWQQEFNGSSDVVGQEIRLNNIPTSVIGVMPEGYLFPFKSFFWLPMPDEILSPTPESNLTLNAYGRVKPGVSIEDATADLAQTINAIYQQNVKLYNKKEGRLRAKVQSFERAQTDGEGPLIFAFFNMVAFAILLLACINVGNLLLARAIQRQKETAIRAALGAPTSRLISQLMWEGVLVTLLGLILAILLVSAALDYTDFFLRSYIQNGLSFWWRWGMDWPTFSMALVFALVTLFLASFLPAWRATRQDINATLRDGTRGAQGKKVGRASRILVIVQVFLISTLMMVGALSAYMSNHFMNIEVGVNYHQVMRGSFELPQDKYQDAPRQIQFFEEFVNRLTQLPNVEGAVAGAYAGKIAIHLDNNPFLPEETQPRVDTMSIIGNTEFYGPYLMEGRHLDSRDKTGSAHTALISASMAKRYWPEQSAIEKRIQLNLRDQKIWFQVVGVVTDRFNGSSMFGQLDTEDEIYISGLQFADNWQDIFYKTPNEQNLAEELFYQVLFQLDHNLEPYDLRPAGRDFSMMQDSMWLTSKITFGAGAFALLLALTGIYGLTANTVAQRTHEIGIRRAVGAADKQVMQLFLKQGSVQLMIGLGCGLALFSIISFVFHSFTDGVVPWHLYPTLSLVVVLSLALIVMVAIYSPVRLALKMEPSSALRYE